MESAIAFPSEPCLLSSLPTTRWSASAVTPSFSDRSVSLRDAVPKSRIELPTSSELFAAMFFIWDAADLKSRMAWRRSSWFRSTAVESDADIRSRFFEARCMVAGSTASRNSFSRDESSVVCVMRSPAPEITSGTPDW